MRNIAVVLFALGLGSFTFAEQVGTRYYARGNSGAYTSPYYVQQNYNTNSTYYGGHSAGQSQFNNQWQVGRRYQVDAYGRPIAGGSMGTSGAAERGYIHNNNPVTLQSIEQREAAIQGHHRYYLETTQSTYKSIAERQAANAQLGNDNSARAQARRQNNDDFIKMFQTVDRINTTMHSREINGTAGYLPPVK